MDRENLQNHAWVIRTAIFDMLPFSAYFAKDRDKNPLFEFEYNEPVEMHNVGYYGNTLHGEMTSESFKRFVEMADAMTITVFVIGEMMKGTSGTETLGNISLIVGGAIWVWSRFQFMGEVRRDFHSDFQHNLYPYEKKKRKRKKMVDGELVEVED